MADADPAHIATTVVIDYLRTEQALGRISSDIAPVAAAGTIVSLCHDRAFQRFLRGNEAPTRSRMDRVIAFIATALEP